MIERLSLNSLKFFYYVARYESVTIAAEKLFVTQSAVSKQLKSLEQVLGLVLFVREARKLSLTSEGEVLFECCQQVFQQIDQCLLQLQQHSKVQNNLILSCEPTLAMKWLIPRLAQFKRLYPEFEVSLLTAGGAVDFKQQGIDLALRRDDFVWGEAVYSEKIADEHMLCVNLKKNKESPANIFISASRPKLWQQFKTRYPAQCRGIKQTSLEHFYLCIEACLAGLGATVVSAYHVEREIEYQILDCVSPIYRDGSSYFLLSAGAFEEDVRKLLFRDWLRDEMNKSQQWFDRVNDNKTE
ncbi:MULTISPECIES: LysR family transcriptional regulator [unclassified Acinetobacter]|uniref:LysR family transcriptional regulator n=1 Tax=unclassified Acinetobacter TaxID=196816 RepID=UPI00124C634A|nr:MULTISPECIES: LysR family transcriptional regulator [unclassified Acinetobacter]